VQLSTDKRTSKWAERARGRLRRVHFLKVRVAIVRVGVASASGAIVVV
jgi:hypothetical protein